MTSPPDATTSKSPATAQTVDPKGRVPFWDNARFVCVTLVVIGHAIQRQTAGSDNALIVYLFIYAWHMPAFAIISGYFSRTGPPNVRQMKKVLTDILLPYVIMESIWTLVQFLVEGPRLFNPTQPSWTLWFLLALGIFRLVLPYLALIRWPLFWSVAVSVGVGYFDNVDQTFSLSRAIGILPFFVFGWKLREWALVDRFRMMDRQAWWLRLTSVGVLAVWLSVVVAFLPTWRDMDLRFWFFYDRSYEGLGEDQWWGGLFRLGLIALAMLLSAAFFVLIPRHDTWMTGFGQATMYIYLLHSFVLYPIRETGLLRDERSSTMWLLTMILASVAVSIALASPLVRRIFRPLIEPKPAWLFVDSDAGGQSKADPTGSRRRDRFEPGADRVTDTPRRTDERGP